MARHMRSRGLPQTLGTASALLTAQALQHGRGAAKWLLQPPPHLGGGAGSAAQLALPEAVLESCLLGRGSPQACMESLVAQAVGGGGGGSGKAAWRPTTAAANIVLGGLAVQGCTADAFRLYGWMKARQEAAEQRVAAVAAAAAASGAPPRGLHVPPAPCSPDEWTLHLLLYAALNAPAGQQLELALRAVQEAR